MGATGTADPTTHAQTDFRGRDGELEILTEALQAPARRTLVVVEGEGGIGKTRLLREALERRGPADGNLTFACSAGAGLQPGLFRDLPATLSSPAWRAAVGGRAPTTLVVDDAHAATGANADALLTILREPVRSDMSVVLALRPRQSKHALVSTLESARAQWHTERVVLRGLSDAHALRLFGAGVCETHRTMLLRQGGGNPRYLRVFAAVCRGSECSRSLPQESALDIPRGVLAPVRTELDHLQDTTRLTAEAAAVIGVSFDIDMVVVVSALPRSRVLVALDELLDADLVEPGGSTGQFRFRHPAFRLATYVSSGAGWRMRAHSRAAEVLRDRPGATLELARHVDHAGAVGDPGSVDVLVAAAATTEAQDPHTATLWYSRALRLLPVQAEARTRRLEILSSLAVTSLLAGRLAECRQALRDRSRILDGADQTPSNQLIEVRCQSTLAQLEGRYTQARAMLRRSIARYEAEHDVTALRLDLAASAACETGWDWSEDALLGAAGSGTRAQQALALTLHARANLTRSKAGVARRSAHEARRVLDSLGDEDIVSELTALSQLGHLELDLEDYDHAERHLNRAELIAERSGQSTVMVVILCGRATLALRRGTVRRATDLVERALRYAASGGSPDLRALALTTDVWTRLSSGETKAHHDDLVSLAREALDSTTPDSPVWRQARLALAAALLEEGCAEKSREVLLDAAGGDDLSELLPAWERGMALGLLSRIDSALDRPQDARRWAESAMQLAERLDLPGLRGIASLALGQVATSRAEALTCALSAIDDACVIEAGHGHLLATEALAAMADPQRAEKHLAAAEVAAESTGCRRLLVASQAMRQSLREDTAAGGSANGKKVVSRREYEIAHLISQGRTNRQIARQLEVSHKTVETHLARIFTKLDVSSRAEIAAMVGSASVVPPPAAAS